MNIRTSYRHTLYASYLGYVTQAVVNNFVPLLLLTFQSTWGISLSRLATLVTVNFGIKLLVDLAGARFVDRIGYRPCIVTAHIMAGVGLICLGILPFCLPDPFVGILLSIMLYAVGGGLTEVLISPIVEACPTDHKDAAMSLLHSFYCWGQAGVVLLSSIFFSFLDIDRFWRVLPFLWAVIPLAGAAAFCAVPIFRLQSEEGGSGSRRLLRSGSFLLFAVMMFCAGAAELTMSQWASSFAESALGVNKTVGDLLGPCMFAVMMGTARLLYGKFSSGLHLEHLMLWGCVLCGASYLLAAFAGAPLLALLGCMLCGLSVGIFWPGVLSTAAQELPGGGISMFALLALAGDVGCLLGPSVAGQIAQACGGDLRYAFCFALIFPLICLSVLLIRRLKKTARTHAGRNGK